MTRMSFVDRLLVWHLRSRTRGFRMVRRLLAGPRDILAKTSYGTVFECNPDEYIGAAVLHHGFYESEVLEALRPFFSQSSTFWDIGANFGLHAVTAAALCSGMRVRAFEPIPSLRSRLLRHASNNSVEVRCFELALSDEAGQFTIYAPPDGVSGRATLRREWAGPTWEPLIVSTARADELVVRGECEMPTVIKIDVEGAELSVLQGFGDLLRDDRIRAIVFEGQPGMAAGETRDPVGSYLQQAGFSLRQLERREPTQHELENYLASR